MDAFDAALEKATSESASPETNTQESTAPSVEQSATPEVDGTSPQEKQAVAQAIAELDKMDKFKLDGQEWTLKDLKAAIMRQKDYTSKTQSLAKDRESFESERKFHENLAWDLKSLEKNPELVNEFLKVYPPKFHKYAEQIIKGATQSQPAQVQSQETARSSQPDVQLLSRLSVLEKFYHDQEVAKNEAAIKNTMDDLTKKYPETDKKLARETVLARAHELYLRQSKPLESDQWETIFKEVADEVKELSKAEYGELVKKQTEANKAGRDVAAGGGTAGRAPQKFKSFDEISKYAEQVVRNGG